MYYGRFLPPSSIFYFSPSPLHFTLYFHFHPPSYYSFSPPLNSPFSTPSPSPSSITALFRHLFHLYLPPSQLLHPFFLLIFLFSLFTALSPSPYLFPLLTHPFSCPPLFYLSFLSGTIPPLCNLLQVTDIKVVTVALEGLENILKAGKATSDQGNYALIESIISQLMAVYPTLYHLIAAFFAFIVLPYDPLYAPPDY